MERQPLISFVLPCLNEEDAVSFCIAEIRAVAQKHNLHAEIVIADNGSIDRSRDIIRSHAEGTVPVRLVEETRRGYGSAYLAGIAGATGDYICMADADGSYDFSVFPHFIAELNKGFDFVIGDRFSHPSARKAMPWAHYYIGNPVLSALVRLLFRTPVHDVHCGQRAIRSRALRKMALSSPGMEFASEMVVRASECGLKVKQIPIYYRKRIGNSKLHAISDGLRHVRYALTKAFSGK
jgi:glycosyltransferase involved in cell wall biosynthesis